MITDHYDLEACGSLIRTRRTAADPSGLLVAEVHHAVVPDAHRLAAAMAAAPQMLALLTEMLAEIEDHPSHGTAMWAEPIRAAIAQATSR